MERGSPTAGRQSWTPKQVAERNLLMRTSVPALQGTFVGDAETLLKQFGPSIHGMSSA